MVVDAATAADPIPASATVIGSIVLEPQGVATDPDGPPVCNSYLITILQHIAQYVSYYGKLYGGQALLLVILGAVAAYRREMSCNRVFHHMDGAAERRGSAVRFSDAGLGDSNEEEEEETTQGTTIARRSKSATRPSKRNSRPTPNHDNGDEMAALLEGADNLSGPLLAATVVIWGYVSMLSLLVKVSKSKKEEEEAVKSAQAAAAAKAARKKQRSLSFDDAMDIFERDSSASVFRLPTKTEFLLEDTSSTAASAPKTEEELLSSPTAPVLCLPPDTIVHSLSFLHPRDVTKFACVSRASRSLVDVETSSHSPSVLLWKDLWWRDYGSVLSKWDVGREAMKRSVGDKSDTNTDAPTDDTVSRRTRSARRHPALRHLESSLAKAKIRVKTISAEGRDKAAIGRLKDDGRTDADDYLSAHHTLQSTMKEFYFYFAEAWINYTIAGKNTLQRCLVGLHGHAYDITDFVESHPGSPETLLVQAGRDASAFFEDLGHSRGARRMALSMCAVMDLSCVRAERSADRRNTPSSSTYSSCGLRYLGAVPDRSDVAASRALASKAFGSLPMGRSKPRRAACLKSVRASLEKGKIRAQLCADKWAASVGNGTSLENGMLGSVRVYWDPLRGEWMAWYTNTHFQPVYLGSDITNFK